MPTARGGSAAPKAPADSPGAIQTWDLVFNALMAAVALGILYYLFEHRFVAFALFRREDGPAEYMSFVAWALAFVLLARAAWSLPARGRSILLAVALVSFLMAGEEISWGQRIFGWESPEFFRAANMQSETTLHNLFESWRVWKVLGWLIVAWCVGAWGLCRLSPRLGHLADVWSIPTVPPHLWPFFFIVVPAGARLFRGDREIAEMLLAFAVLALAIHIWGRSGAPPWGMSIGATTAIAILIGTPALAWILGLISPPRRVDPLESLAARRLALGHYRQAETVFSYLDRTRTAERGDFLLLWALALAGTGRAGDALDRALLHVEGELAGSTLTAENLDIVRTPSRARDLALALCMLDRHPEAVLLLRHAQSIDLARLKRPLKPAQEAMTQVSLNATLLMLGIPRSAAEMRESLAQVQSRQLTRRADRILGSIERYVAIAGCDLRSGVPPKSEPLAGESLPNPGGV